ncbi:MAG: hypothetical protein ACFB9M_01725 [Myxococcota bacterium]
MKKLAICSLSAALFAAPLNAAWATGGTLFGSPDRPTVAGELGYSGLPRASYLYPFSPQFSIGGEFILDLGLFYRITDSVPGTVTLAAGAPIKLVLSEKNKIVIGTEFTPGIGIGIDTGGVSFDFDEGGTTVNQDESFALLLHSGVHVGYKADPQLIVGGGVEIPLTIYFSSVTFAVVPILFGPMVEYEVLENLAITGDLKLGPHIGVGDFGNTGFGFKFQAGVAYAL